MIERSALAPVSFFIACRAIARSAPSSNESSTSSSRRSFWYCLMIAFFGSRRIRTYISSSRLLSVQTIGSRPMNSGIIPNARRSSLLTLDRISLSLSYASLSSAENPIEVCLVRRCLMMPSSAGNAPPQMNRIFFVSTVVIGTIAFLEFAPTGTSTSEPSRSFNSPCCTASPDTSLEFRFCFFASLSISSMKTMPFSALSTSLSASARSLLIQLSTSSPI